MRASFVSKCYGFVAVSLHVQVGVHIKIDENVISTFNDRNGLHVEAHTRGGAQVKTGTYKLNRVGLHVRGGRTRQ